MPTGGRGEPGSPNARQTALRIARAFRCHVYDAIHGIRTPQRAPRAPYHLDTIYMLASVSKTVVATAAMQAVERGLIDLDADINEILPFRVHSPSHPSRVTARCRSRLFGCPYRTAPAR